MIEADRRKGISPRERETIYSCGGPLLGGYYAEDEIDVVVKTIRASMEQSEGFGFNVKEIQKFERELAEFRVAKHAISISGAGTGLDMAMMALDMEQGEEATVVAINLKSGRPSTTSTAAPRSSRRWNGCGRNGTRGARLARGEGAAASELLLKSRKGVDF